MTEYFNFLGLPTVVQDLIAAEIVHNSIPQDWLQFALTCKAFNELVKHAQPKKILPSIIIGRFLAEKLANVQLFELHFNQFLTKKVCQELFESVKFKDDAKIQFQYYSLKNNEYAVHMRCIGQDLFEIECFSCRPRFCRPRGRSGPSRSNKDFAITTAIIKSDMLVETLKKLDDSQV
uniref:F-box domain-containing protein n=1 Tax=Panagrolaimus sp. JU765 TaxID=591449 RepID=A0AC34R9T5_9BILA